MLLRWKHSELAFNSICPFNTYQMKPVSPCETSSEKSRSAHKSNSNRTQTSILVATNTWAGGVARMGIRAGAKAAIARVCARRDRSA